MVKDAYCDRCFAALKPGEAYCPDCGAPTGETTPAADSAVHGELAQANLLRLRGRLDESEKLLLGILRRFPNDPHAHEMLGDVCVERDEYERAIEWYDLALDLAPSSPDVRRKIDETRTRIEARATADTAESLGLPSASSPPIQWPLIASAGVLLLAIGIAVWPRSSPAPLRASVVAPLPPVASPSTSPPATASPVETPTPVVLPLMAEEDRSVLNALQARSVGARVQGVLSDPRSAHLIVTFGMTASEDAKASALGIGKEALIVAPSASTVTLRGLSEGKLAFVADLSRSTADTSEPLSNVWPAEPAATSPTATPTAPSTSDTTGASSTPSVRVVDPSTAVAPKP